MESSGPCVARRRRRRVRECLHVEGIFYAMISGSIAADTALAANTHQKYNPRILSQYENQWKREIGDELQHSVEIQHRFFNGSGRLD
jgi:flavin-dependent dehydrogenase